MTEPKAPMEEAVKEAVEVLTALRSATAFDPEDAQMSQVEKYLCARAQRGIDTALAALNPTVCLALIARARDAERLEDKVDGLTADLREAVEVAFLRGATEWVRLNYPADFKRLSALNEGGPANG